MIDFEYILLEDDFKQWRDKFNYVISQIRKIEEYPDMTDKSGYILSTDGENVKWIPQEDILENFGIKPGSGDITVFDSGITIGNFAITLETNGKISTIGDIIAEGTITAKNGFIGNLTGNVTGDISGNAGSANKLKTSRYIDGIAFDGSKNIHHYATCSTGASASAKVITCSGFSLYAGARLSVVFTATNTAQLNSITFNINNTGEKNFYIPGTAGVVNSQYPDGYKGLFYNGKKVYTFLYDGTAFILENLSPFYYMNANTGIDLNTCIYPGKYFFERSSSIQNIPYGTGGWMDVVCRNPQNTTLISQFWKQSGTLNTNDHYMFVRTGSSSGTNWSAWSKIMSEHGDNHIDGLLEVDDNITGNKNLIINGTGYVKGTTTFVGASTFSKNINVSGSATVAGTITGSKVYNAVFNDYAEYFERGEETEPGDIIALDIHSEQEKYVKATPINEMNIVGVHSDSYGHILGGETPPDPDTSFEEHNIKNFIPVGLVGRVNMKIHGIIQKGNPVSLSQDLPGVGVRNTSGFGKIIGFAVESNNNQETKLVKVKLTI